MELPNAIEPDQLKTAVIAVLVVLGLFAFIAMRLIQKMATRVIMVGVLVAAGVYLYAQRDDIDACQQRVRRVVTAPASDEECTCEFLGMEVKVPACTALVPEPDE